MSEICVYSAAVWYLRKVKTGMTPEGGMWMVSSSFQMVNLRRDQRRMATELRIHTVEHILADMTVGTGRICAMPPPSQRIYRRGLRRVLFVWVVAPVPSAMNIIIWSPAGIAQLVCHIPSDWEMGPRPPLSWSQRGSWTEWWKMGGQCAHSLRAKPYQRSWRQTIGGPLLGVSSRYERVVVLISK